MHPIEKKNLTKMYPAILFFFVSGCETTFTAGLLARGRLWHVDFR